MKSVDRMPPYVSGTHCWMLFIALTPVMSENLTIKVGVILVDKMSEPFDLPRIGPALSIAFERIQRDFGIRFEPFYRNHTGVCPWEPPLGILAELYYINKIQAVIGPACSQGVESAGRLAHYLGLPMVTGLGDLTLRSYPNDMFKTLTKLSYNIRKMSYSMSAVMSEYSWRHSAIIYDEAYILWRVIGENLVLDFREVPILERPYDIPFTLSPGFDFKKILMEAQRNARVFILICYAETFREMMYAAYELGMTSGDYVFITLELFPSEWMGFYQQFLRGDSKDDAVTMAYRSVLIVTLTQPDLNDSDLVTFSEEVKRRAKIQYGYVFGPDEHVNYFITAFYDSALYLANVYNITLSEGGDVTNGHVVSQRLWNSSFQGLTGSVAVDEIGERVADFDVLHMVAEESLTFKMVGRFLGATLRYTIVRKINWVNGQPRDVPVCGFVGDLCVVKDDEDLLGVMVTTPIAVVTMVIMAVVLLLYRRMKRRHAIERRMWQVSISEIVVQRHMTGSYFGSKMSAFTIPSMNKSDEGHRMYIEIGYCRGQKVAIRTLHAKSLVVTEKLQRELYDMYRTSHQNVAKFVGACMIADGCRVLMEYCARGSLQDILQNDSIDLDWHFRYSLINDIIKGMVYLHASPLHVHGRLTSTNCVIDSRFLLKITDYGLPAVFAGEREKEGELNADVVFNKLMWTAPELLRDMTSSFAVRQSQTGDLYSFGIILHEIVTREAPWDDTGYTKMEIVKQLIERRDGVFRPTSSPETECPFELRMLMEQCWCEDPDLRPNFSIIDHKFRKIRAGKSGNLLDNLLERMSQYADNLEALAAERTKQYVEEKNRAEELLLRLLPRSVARQLQSGNVVIPEMYQCATVYFSDIVGFTTLAAMSTPIQVVDLLNDLFTLFDQTIDSYDVYKVETIGDAYMVVSGLPERNGDAHVTEISGMALDMMKIIKNFTVRHRPDHQMKIRAGIHSGPVVAGVVGNKMPRYCLFGDTVNTASRMESTSEPLRVQLTEATKILLDGHPDFITSVRGVLEIKVSMEQTTHFDNTRSLGPG